LVKYTPPEHLDYEKLSQALMQIKNIADTVNASKQRYDQIGKMFEVSARIDPQFASSIVAPHRTFILDV
jgi:hypothetical protein